MSLHTRVNFGIQSRLSATVAGDTGAMPHSVDRQLIWASGTGADQADRAYASSGTLAGSEALTIDLSPGPSDAFGNAATMASVRALYVENTGDTGLAVGGSNGIAGAGFVLRAGQSAMFAVGPDDATGWAVAGGSTDAITITNQSSDDAGAYRVVVIGASA